MIGDIAKKLNALYKEDPSIYDRCSPDEILEILHQRFDNIANEPDDMIYDDEYDDPSVMRRNGGYIDE